MYIHKCNHQKVQQTNNKQAAGSKKTSTHNAANNQEKQKTQTSPNKNKNEIKTHRKKAGTTSNHAYKCKHKKTQRIISKQGAAGKNNTPGSLDEKTRKNDKNINFVEKK